MLNGKICPRSETMFNNDYEECTFGSHKAKIGEILDDCGGET